MFEVWQNLAPFGSRLTIGCAVEVLLTKVVNWRLSVSSIVVFFVAIAVSIKHNQTVLRVLFSAGGAESVMLSAPALRV
jgi:hypothetical protein